MKRVLVAGIGNIFLGDDGFGCEVARRLASHAMPDGVDVVDFGIRGMDLKYALEDAYELVILVDTVERGGAPGTLYVIEPSLEAAAPELPPSPHGMDPATVLGFVAGLRGAAPRVLLIACEPDWLGGEEGHMGLSDAVTASVDEAVAEILALLRDAADSGRGPRPAMQPRMTVEGAGRLREE